MNLTLKNFKCWSEKTFNFPKNGLILISGSSGCGKSSLLNSIYFAISGKNGIVSYNEHKCEVTLEIKDQLIIKRQKGPRRLIIIQDGNQLEEEDDHAQSLINRKFGDNFLITSYVVQKSFNHFFEITANEKLLFLENLLFGQDQISKLKESIREKIKISKNTTLILTGKTQSAKDEYKCVKKPTEKIELKLKIIVNEKLSESHLLKQINQKEVEFINTLVSSQKELTKLQTQFDQVIDYKNNLINKKKQLEEQNLKIQKIIKDISDIKFIGDEKFNELEGQIKLAKQQKEYKNKVNQITLLEKEILEYNQEREKVFQEMEINLKNDLEVIYQKLDECKVDNNLNELKREIEKLILQKSKEEKLNKLPKDYKDQLVNAINEKREIADKLESIASRLNIQKCPSCQSSLITVNHVLQSSNKNPVSLEEKKLSEVLPKKLGDLSISISKLMDIKRQHESLSKEIDENLDTNLLEEKLNKFHKIQNLQLNQLEYLQNKTKIERDINNIRKVPDTSLMMRKKVELTTLQTEISTIKEIVVELNYQELISEYKQQNIYKNNIAAYTSNLNIVEKYYQIILLEVSDLQKKIKSIDVSKIDEVKESIKSTIENLEMCKQDKCNLLQYEEYQQKLKIYKDAKNKLIKAKSEEETELYTLTKLEKLNKKVMEAESIALQNTIESLNTSIKGYLEILFEEPINMQIELFKETKKEVKSQINIKMNYKGNEIEFSDLSGGEKDRCSLALTLALNNLTESNIILLDECLSSLNEELIHELMEMLREIAKTKLILIVSHGIIHGEFDHIITL